MEPVTTMQTMIKLP